MTVSRRTGPWAATITEVGHHYLDHGDCGIQLDVPTLAELLPRAAGYLTIPVDDGEAPFSFGLVWTLVEMAGRDTATLGRVSEIGEDALADLADLVESGETALSESEISLARLAVAVSTARRACQFGNLEATQSWVIRGLGGPEGASVQEFDLGVIRHLLALAKSGDVTAVDLVADFAFCVFYASNKAGYLREVTDSVGASLAAFIAAYPATVSWGAGVDAVPQALAWAKATGRARLLTALRAWCTTAAAALDVAPPGTRFDAGPSTAVAVSLRLAAACSLDDGDQRTEALAALVNDLESVAALIPHLLTMQVLTAACASDASVTRALLPRLLESIRNRWADVQKSVSADELAAMRDRQFDIIGPPLLALSTDGDLGNVTELLRTWLGVDADPLDQETAARFRATIDGLETINAWQGGSCRVPAAASSADLADALNDALGLALQSTDASAPPVTQAATEQRNLGAGPALERVCRDLLALDRCPDFVESLGPGTRLIALPGQPIPYQALLAERGAAPALWISMREPAPDRPVRRALVVQGNTELSTIESELVIATLASAQVHVEHASGAGATTALVTDALAADEFDVIWVTAHGRQPAYAPGDAAIYLPGGQTLLEQDLRVAPEDPALRRLLVLNCCEAATTVMVGGVRTRGLAAAATAPHQAVIGHQWKVAEHFAAAFGVLLAFSLTREPSFDRAFNQTLGWVRRPWTVNAECLQEAGLDSELVEKLGIKREFGENILDWGAPALYC